jgi:hypothetical protein
MGARIEAMNLGLAGGIIWGLSIFLMTLVSDATGYAREPLLLLGNIYLGYNISLLGSIIGLVYGFFDVFIALWLLAYIYNLLQKMRG